MFGLLNAVIAAAVLGAVDARFSFTQYQTDSVLLSMPRDTQTGLLIMGTSRARIMTRVKCNHEAFENALGCSVFNIAIPFGGGIVPEKIYLEQFYNRGNHARAIIYFLDPFTMFSPFPNQLHRFVYYEPLRPSMLLALARNEIPFQRILIYIQSKFTWRWLTQAPGTVLCDDARVQDPSPDPEKVRKRVESLYFHGLSEDHFTHYARTLRDILEMAKRDNARMIIALPPTLLGPQPGIERLRRQLEEFAGEYTFEFYDFTGAVTDPALYGDYDHLNSAGIGHFVQEHVAPLFNQ